MTTATITPAGISALAALVHELRPEWDRRGIAAAIHDLAGTVPADQLAIAFIRGARDDANRLPVALTHLNNRAWSSDWYLPCKDHPETRQRHSSGECAACRADRIEAAEPGVIRDRGGVAPAAEVRATLVAAVRRPVDATAGTATSTQATDPSNVPDVEESPSREAHGG